MRFAEATKEDLPQIYGQMLANFIPDELRDYDDVVRLFGHNYKIEHILLDGVRTGFMGTWQVGDYTFLEHFVIYEQFRNRGIGGQALECMQEKAGRLLLETELPVEPMAARRMNFYLRHRMALNPQKYFQPPHRPTGNACPLKLNFRRIAKENPGNEAARDVLAWIDEHFDDMEEEFFNDDFIYNSGYMFFSVKF